MPAHCATTPCEEDFRFMDLPPELRNWVYQYALLERRIQRLRCFTTPALSRVCRQLRNETLPIFFYLNTFVAEVKSTFIGYAGYDYDGRHPQYVERCSRNYQTTGVVSIASDVNPLRLERHAVRARFLNIDFCLMHPNEDVYGNPKYEQAVLSLRYRQAEPTVHVQPNMWRGHEKDHFELHRVLEEAKAVLKAIIATTRHEGLTFEQVQDTAMAFRADYICYKRNAGGRTTRKASEQTFTANSMGTTTGCVPFGLYCATSKGVYFEVKGQPT